MTVFDEILKNLDFVIEEIQDTANCKIEDKDSFDDLLFSEICSQYARVLNNKVLKLDSFQNELRVRENRVLLHSKCIDFFYLSLRIRKTSLKSLILCNNDSESSNSLDYFFKSLISLILFYESEVGPESTNENGWYIYGVEDYVALKIPKVNAALLRLTSMDSANKEMLQQYLSISSFSIDEEINLHLVTSLPSVFEFGLYDPKNHIRSDLSAPRSVEDYGIEGRYLKTTSKEYLLEEIGLLPSKSFAIMVQDKDMNDYDNELIKLYYYVNGNYLGEHEYLFQNWVKLNHGDNLSEGKFWGSSWMCKVIKELIWKKITKSDLKGERNILNWVNRYRSKPIDYEDFDTISSALKDVNSRSVFSNLIPFRAVVKGASRNESDAFLEVDFDYPVFYLKSVETPF